MGFSSKNTAVGCHLLLQGIFLTQGSNPGLLLGRQILYHCSSEEALNTILLDKKRMQKSVVPIRWSWWSGERLSKGWCSSLNVYSLHLLIRGIHSSFKNLLKFKNQINVSCGCLAEWQAQLPRLCNHWHSRWAPPLWAANDLTLPSYRVCVLARPAWRRIPGTGDFFWDTPHQPGKYFSELSGFRGCFSPIFSSLSPFTNSSLITVFLLSRLFFLSPFTLHRLSSNKFSQLPKPIWASASLSI